MLRRFLALLVCLPVCCAAMSARADASSDAADLKKKGDELMVSLQYREALEAYERAYAISADPALLYNRARAHQALTEYPQALDLLETFSTTAPPDLKARVPYLTDLLADIRSRVATIDVRCDVGGARVFVRDKLETTLPSEQKPRVRAGPAKIEVRADGYVPWVKDVDLRGGAVTTLDVRLLKAVEDGRAILTLSTSPASAEVFIDGRPLGTAPLETTLTAGRHAVVARSEGHEDSNVDVELTSGERRKMDLHLSPKGSIFGKWWFWTAVGAVVVTGIIVVVAVNTESSAPSGTITPGQVRGPLTIGF